MGRNIRASGRSRHWYAARHCATVIVTRSLLGVPTALVPGAVVGALLEELRSCRLMGQMPYMAAPDRS